MAEDMQGGSASIVDRAKRILVEPKTEWERIDGEPATVGSIFTSWVVILAAIPAIATLVGSLVFGYRFFGIVYRPPIVTAVGTAIVQYVLSLVSVFVLSLVIDALAPTFGGTKNNVQATKVAAYSMTAGWIAGIVNIIPQLAILGVIGGLYSIYLLYLGLPRLMKAAADKAAVYTAAVIVAAIVLYFVIGAATAAVTGLFGPSRPMMPVGGEQLSGTVAVPGMGTVDLGKLQDASQRMEATSKRLQAGEAQPAVAPTALQALLPESLGPYRRVEVSNSGVGAGGVGGSTAEGRYESGGSSFALTLSDISAAGALAAMGSALNVQSSRQTATGYERTENVGGRMTTEKWDMNSKQGEYGVLVADRFMVQASGTVPNIDVLKGAVNAVGLSKLESMKG